MMSAPAGLFAPPSAPPAPQPPPARVGLNLPPMPQANIPQPPQFAAPQAPAFAVPRPPMPQPPAPVKAPPANALLTAIFCLLSFLLGALVMFLLRR